jgi:hypothetical protein
VPSGLHLESSSGEITGVPTTEGSNSVEFFLIDANKNAAHGIVSLNITPTLTISSSELPGGITQKAYSATLAATWRNCALHLEAVGRSSSGGTPLESQHRCDHRHTDCRGIRRIYRDRER